jgi:Meckel syndrome type 1 protein
MPVAETAEGIRFAALLVGMLADAAPQDGAVMSACTSFDDATTTTDAPPAALLPMPLAALPLPIPPALAAPEAKAMAAVPGAEIAVRAAIADVAPTVAMSQPALIATAPAAPFMAAMPLVAPHVGPAPQPATIQQSSMVPVEPVVARVVVPVMVSEAIQPCDALATARPAAPSQAPPITSLPDAAAPAAMPVGTTAPPPPPAAQAPIAPIVDAATATAITATPASAIVPEQSNAAPDAPRRIAATLDTGTTPSAPDADASPIAAPSPQPAIRTPIPPEPAASPPAPLTIASPEPTPSGPAVPELTPPDAAVREITPAEPTTPASAQPQTAEPALTPPPPAAATPLASPATPAVPPPAARPAAPIPWPARQVAPFAIALALGPDASLSLTLEPAALGRVEVEIARNGTDAQISLRAERPETLALLLRDRAELERALGGAGFGGEEGRGPSLSFGLGAGGEGQRERRPTPREPTRENAPDRRSAARIAAPAALPPPAAARGLLDLAI